MAATVVPTRFAPGPATTDALTEGSTNLYFTVARTRATDLTGLSLSTSTAVVAADTVLAAIGKLQAQLNARPLTGGTTGQVLKKNSSTDYDFSWANDATGSGGSGPSLIVLASDVTNNNATLNTMQDVTGLGIPVTAGKTYKFNFLVNYTVTAATTGTRWGLNGPTFSFLLFDSTQPLSATTSARIPSVGAYDMPAASQTSSGSTTNNLVNLIGVITVTASGTLNLRFAAEIASGNVTVKAITSTVEYTQLN